MSDATDRALDPELVAELYVQHGEELKRFLWGVLRDGALVSDVLQAAFTRLIERGGEAQEGARKAWLFRVAFNEAMAVRRRGATGQRALERLSWVRSAVEGPADEPLIRLEAIEAVRAALDELPPEQQRIVRLRMYEHKTFAEIARELNIPLGTALTRMRLAAARLREHLSARGHTAENTP